MKKIFTFLNPQGPNYYFPSGNNSTIGLIIGGFVTLLTAIISGLLYNAILIVIPFIYLNFILSIGLAITIGYGVKIISRLSAIRSYKTRILFAISFSVIAFYIQWFAYSAFYTTEEIILASGFLKYGHMLYKPGEILSTIVEINKIGPWSVFGVHFTGFLLTLIWIIESIIILVVPVLFVNNTPITPYSEMLNKWYPKYQLKHDFGYLAALKVFQKNLETSLNSAIENLGKGDAFRHSKFSVFYLPDETKQYLFVENVYIENRGKGTKKITPALLFYAITADDAKSLMDTFGCKKVLMNF